MRLHPSPRDVNAAGLFTALAVLAVVGAAAMGSLVLALVGGVSAIVAAASLRGYPIDRDW